MADPPETPSDEPPEEAVRRAARLARLEVTPEEVERLAPQFARILDAFRELAEVDVEAAEEMTRAGPREAGASEPRADEPRPSLAVDAALGNAPARRDDFYGVPRTVGGVE